MSVPENPTMKVERAAGMGFGIGIGTKLLVRLADGQPNPRFDERRLVELSSDARGSPIERRSHLQIRIGCVVRPRLVVGARLRQQVVLQEFVDTVGDGL